MLYEVITKQVAIITGRSSGIVERRARELRIEHFYQGVHNKREVLESLLEKLDLKMENVAAIGDDLNDLSMLRAVGLSFVPSDASRYVDKEADIILTKKGGVITSYSIHYTKLYENQIRPFIFYLIINFDIRPFLAVFFIVCMQK